MNLPTLDELGVDLLRTTPGQRRAALLRPYAGIMVFIVVAWAGWWWLTPLIVFGIFVAVVTATHDVVHRTLGLSDRQTDVWLFLSGLVLLESGHAYRMTHRQHHRTFPGPDDPEGYPANLSFLGAVLYGPVFLVRLWLWSFGRADRVGRRWLVVEAIAPVSAVAGGILLWPVTPALLAYATMAIVGSWVYPLLTVYLPHHDYGDEPLTQTRTLRGRIIPAVFLELTYHLEHHLYPQVPSHNLPELARRLDPVLAAAGQPAGAGAVTAKAEPKERVLRVAIQSLATHGYVGTTARSIAAIGGFAPGVLYYYYADLDEVLIATAEYASDQRELRYRDMLDVTGAAATVEKLRLLYAEDADSGHIEAIQELVAAARPGSPLAAAVSAHTKRWELLAEQVIRNLLRGSPLGRLVKVPVVARAVVAYYMGMQTLTHLDGDAERPRAAFAQAARLAAAFDKLPKIRAKAKRPAAD